MFISSSYLFDQEVGQVYRDIQVEFALIHYQLAFKSHPNIQFTSWGTAFGVVGVGEEGSEGKTTML